MTLVEHHPAELGEAAPVEHVAEDLRRHDEDAAVGVDLHVAGEDADGVGAERAGEVAELLVGERLERRRVGDALAGLERGLDGELGNERLAGPGGSRDDHGLSGSDGATRLDLEVVERKRIARLEALEQPGKIHVGSH